MIDVKKLITGFLILATAAVCSGLVVSLVNTGTTASAAGNGSQITINGTDPQTLAQNAFIDPADLQNVVDAVAPELASSSMMVTSSDPTNLTDSLAAEFVNGVVAANPDGPTGTDADGNATFVPPDVNSLAADIAQSTTTQNLQIPDWDIEADSIPVNVLATSTPDQLTTYGNAINDVLSGHLNDQVQTILSNQTGSADPSDLAYVQSQVQSALQDAASLQTPAPAKAFQKSLITELVYEKNLLALNTLAQTDPVKASLIFQQEDDRFGTVRQNFLNNAQTLENTSLSLLAKPAPQKKENFAMSFVDNTFGIHQADALWPVFDPATWGLLEANQGEVIAHQLEQILKNTLLQILKNTLIAIVQREVLTWVQGSGAPRFITNWGTQLINAYQTTAINSLNSLMSCGTYASFVPTIKITLGAYYKPGNNTCANQFAAALGSNSFNQFYKNFKNGGFVAFGASTLPTGNPYGGLFFDSQIVGSNGANASAAAAAKTTATGGFKGGEKCDDGSDPNNGEHTVCENPDGADYTISGNESCGPGDTPVVYGNEGVCSDGTQPVVTTPAAVTGFALNSGIDATPKQIAAANDIAGILNSVLSSLITQLASTAVNAAGKLVNNELTAINASGIQGGGTAPAPAPLACTPISQVIPLTTTGTGPGGTGATGGTSSTTYPITLSAGGGKTDSSGNPPSYSWSASNGATSTGSTFSGTFATVGTYTITLNDSAGDAPANCTVIVQ